MGQVFPSVLNIPKRGDGASYKTLSPPWVIIDSPGFASHRGFKKGNILGRSKILLCKHSRVQMRPWDVPLGSSGCPNASRRDPAHARCLWGGMVLKPHLSLQVNNCIFKRPTECLIYTILWEGSGFFLRFLPIKKYLLTKNFQWSLSTAFVGVIFFHKDLYPKYDTLRLQKKKGPGLKI